MSTDAAARTAGPKTRTPSSPGITSVPASTSGPAPAAAPKVRKETVAIRDGLKVVRLIVPTSGSVPEHHSSVAVVATILRGAGTFTISGRSRPVRTGDVIDMAPGVHHAIHADDELECIIVHARISLPPGVQT